MKWKHFHFKKKRIFSSTLLLTFDSRELEEILIDRNQRSSLNIASWILPEANGYPRIEMSRAAEGSSRISVKRETDSYAWKTQIGEVWKRTRRKARHTCRFYRGIEVSVQTDRIYARETCTIMEDIEQLQMFDGKFLLRWKIRSLTREEWYISAFTEIHVKSYIKRLDIIAKICVNILSLIFYKKEMQNYTI